jgi:hypothetical protein
MQSDPYEKARRLRQRAWLTLDPRMADLLRTAARKYEAELSADAG